MPRCFFDIRDGRSVLDREGSYLPDIYAAQAEAVKLAGAILRDTGAGFWDSTEWVLEVTDEQGLVLFVLRVSGEE